MFFSKIRAKREAELKRQRQASLKKAGVAFLVGSTLSAVVTLFTAPKSGKELRQDVKDKVEEGTEVVKDQAARLASKTGEVVEDVVSKSQIWKDKVVLKIKEAKLNVKENAEEVIENVVEEVADEISELTDLEDEVQNG